MAQYSEKLKDPRWQRKRLEIFQRDDWSCVNCGDYKNTLHVHHLVYIPQTEPWEYPDDKLVTLCEKCHETESDYSGELINIMKEALLTSRFFVKNLIRLVMVIMYEPSELKEFINKKYFEIESKKENKNV